MELLLVGFLKIPRHQAAAAGHVINNNNIKKEVNYGKFNNIGIEGRMSCMSMTELMHTKAFSTRKVSVISYLLHLFRYDSFRRKHHIQGLLGYSGNYIGRSWIDRITFKNSLDPINGVWWSDEIMDDLFS